MNPLFKHPMGRMFPGDLKPKTKPIANKSCGIMWYNQRYYKTIVFS